MVFLQLREQLNSYHSITYRARFDPRYRGSDRATRLRQRGLTALVLFFHWDSVPAPDAPRGLFFLHVFAAATGAKSTLLPTSLDSRVQIRPFCTRHAVFERSRVQIRPFCPCRPSLILTRTVARARSAQGVSQFAAGYAAVRRTASPDSI